MTYNDANCSDIEESEGSRRGRPRARPEHRRLYVPETQKNDNDEEDGKYIMLRQLMMMTINFKC
jgi:hypothetical protein